jgi:four helix bundle protein
MEDYPKLHHEDLDAYKAAIEFCALAVAAAERFPRGYSPLADQLRRAAFSMPLNIAEGYGKRTPDDRSRFYDIARGSAHECGAVWDVARVAGILEEATFVRGKALLVRIVSMLVKMVASPNVR